MKRITSALLTFLLCFGLFAANAVAAVPFTDVEAGAYYYDAVNWAVEENVTQGTSATTFSPNANCTRAQVVTFLWRAYGCPESSSSENPFSDVKSSDYYYKAVLWAVENEITTGVMPAYFAPGESCTRGQVVTFLWRAAGQPEPMSDENPFSDVYALDYYHRAVLWAVEKDITKGTGAATFSPYDTCTRGQIVTFLYRYFSTPAQECSHEYNNACDTGCNLCGATREVNNHVYADDQDLTCDICGATRVVLPEIVLPDDMIPDDVLPGNLVWIPVNGGTKYHSKATCSGMEAPRPVTVESAQAMGYSACKKCY